MFGVKIFRVRSISSACCSFSANKRCEPLRRAGVRDHSSNSSPGSHDPLQAPASSRDPRRGDRIVEAKPTPATPRRAAIEAILLFLFVGSLGWAAPPDDTWTGIEGI